MVVGKGYGEGRRASGGAKAILGTISFLFIESLAMVSRHTYRAMF